MSVQMREQWRIRRMLPPDVPEILVIERAVYESPWTERIFRDCLRVGYRAWVACAADRQISGYALASIAAGEAHLLNLCVAAPARGRGVADQLLQTVIEQATEENAAELLLEVRPSNTAARRLYARYGFEFRGRRPNYYPAGDGREDALVLARVMAP